MRAGWLSAKVLGDERRVVAAPPAPTKEHYGTGKNSGDSFGLTRGATPEGVAFVRGELGSAAADAADLVLVFVHDAGLNAGAWGEVFGQLRNRWTRGFARFRVACVELSGHGASRAAEPRDFERSGPKDIFAVLYDERYGDDARPA